MTILINQPHPSIDRDSIDRLVEIFYGRAREDEIIGPIFNRTVKDWDHHLARISEFWSSVILKTGGYDGRPMPPHLALNLENEHFDRWLELFEQTAREIFPPEAAIIFVDRARRIADSFEMAIATHSGRIRAPRHSRRPLIS
ncbi:MULTISPECIES: group III truncated hemoglobin [Brucella]|uniref:SEC-independent protein translocase protein TatC n=7 Tax=Brucella/Ochrobactrum group TaxID=2826938 RepID=C0RM44_BRUMB|nr:MULTISPECIES: group III truncated hemoglobin [Brucella]EXU84622.1 preprotein translocase subunit TatC [Brucella melitensis 548]AAL53640.1 sec-independent protein translocase protein tatc [Brucella melitensis bv. 1 str. 16M]ACO02677.1 SEC-independent protein translocase protein TatC [Brucella melitensis ATCC 23457]ACU50006.1 SEC-independent protein translocase [Brucella microti CCM 4915]ADZ68111.1 SEC-independent protein translocase protein TatC [Brucella melitensis M28]